MAASKVQTIVFLFGGLILTVAVCLYLFVLGDVSLAQIIDLLRDANPSWLLIFILLSFTTSAFRLWRYRLLLHTAGYSPPALPLFLVVLVRNTFADLLPARIGTLVFVFLTTTRLGVPLGATSSSFALALVFDIIAIVPLILVCVLTLGSSELISRGSLALTATSVLLAGLFSIWALPKVLHASEVLLRRLASKIPVAAHLSERASKLAHDIFSAVDQARTQGIYGRIFALSIFVRLGKYLCLYALLAAILSPQGISIQALPFEKVFLAQIAAELGASLPISGPMGVGGYQAGWILMFTLLGFPADLIGPTSIAHHAASQVWGYSLGLIAMLLLMLPFMRRIDLAHNPEPRLEGKHLFALKLAGFIVFVSALCVGLYYSHR